MEQKFNWKCKECGHICGIKGSIINHWNKHHEGNYHKMIEPTSEDPTNPKKEAIHKRIYNEQGDKIHYKCKKCGHTCRTESGIRTHLNNHHSLSTNLSFEETLDALTNTKKGRRKKKKRNIQQKTHKKKKDKNMCPGGGTFGKDTDELPECENCFIWDECDSSNSNDDENSEADKILKRHSESNKEKEEREFPKFPIEIRIDLDGMRIITPVPIEITQIVIPKKGNSKC